MLCWRTGLCIQCKKKTVVALYLLSAVCVRKTTLEWDSSLFQTAAQDDIQRSESAVCELTESSAIKAVINLRVSFLWIWPVVLTPGREQREPALLHLSLDGVIQNIWGKDGGWADRKRSMGPLVCANLAKQSSTAVTHICPSMWLRFEQLFLKTGGSLCCAQGWLLTSLRWEKSLHSSRITNQQSLLPSEY